MSEKATAGGRVVMVTGGAAGIGLATAEAFAAGGDTVVIADLDAAAAGSAAAGLGAGHLGLGLDVADEAAVTAAIAETVSTLGGLDVLVANAGIGDPQKPTLDQSIDDFRRILRVHLDGTFLCAREAARVMAAQGRGAIVNLCSIAGLVGLPRRNAYGAAKAGIASMTRSLACEWASAGIRVNAVAPGYVETALVAKLVAEGRLDAGRILRRTPMGRMARPAEIAAAIRFLASPEASFVTGVVLEVDGGWRAYGDSGDASAADA